MVLPNTVELTVEEQQQFIGLLVGFGESVVNISVALRWCGCQVTYVICDFGDL